MIKDDSMPLGKVPDYVNEKYGFRRSRMTVYNWAKNGVVRGGERYVLETFIKGGTVRTMPYWVDNFVAVLERQK